MNIGVLGAGNWGTTLAIHLAELGNKVILWEYNEELAKDMIKHGENRTFLPGFSLPVNVSVTWLLSEAVSDAQILLIVVPSHVVRSVVESVAQHLASPSGMIFLSASKGIEERTDKLLSQVIEESLNVQKDSIVAVSGPCIANEVVRKIPTTAVCASTDQKNAELIQKLLMSPTFRLYTSDDPIGVQLGGSLKNITAIAAGICDGLGFGANTKSALITRGLAEITRLGVRLGAHPETFSGLSGMGDLITTCFSPHSRNRHVGEEIGLGRKVKDVLDEMVMIAEGVRTTRAAFELSKKVGVDMPITEQVYDVLFHNKEPRRAVEELMKRDRKHEREQYIQTDFKK